MAEKEWNDCFIYEFYKTLLKMHKINDLALAYYSQVHSKK